jgi:formate dehydrogenase major subunit
MLRAMLDKALACAQRDFGRCSVEQSPRERLTTPLIRENGQHRPATWDEALKLAVNGIRSEVERRGPRTFGMFSCSKTTNELNFVAQKFVRSVIGSNNVDSCNRT